MQPDPSHIQKLTERVEALEKQVFEWKIIYEEQKRRSLVGLGIVAIFLVVYALIQR